MSGTHTHAVDRLLSDLEAKTLDRRQTLQRILALGLGASATATVHGSLAQDATPATGANTIYGYDIEPAQNEGGQLIQADISILRNWTFSTGGWPGMSETLTIANPQTFETEGVLAESWEGSDDLTVWTFHLREGVTWHDGETFDADDVKFSYELHAAPDNVAATITDTRETAQLVESIDVIDPLTVQMTLKQPVVDFPLLLGNITILAEHVLGDVPPAELVSHAASTGSDPAFIVFTGPFKFQEFVEGSHMTLVRHDDYWNGRPHLDEVIVREVPDTASQFTQLRSGEIDCIWAVDPAAVAGLEGTDVEIVPVQQTYMWMYYYNLDPEKSPFFQDERVRQALLLAIDREQIINAVMFGFGEVAVGLMPPQSWAKNLEGVTERYPHDPERARQLLDEAGWVDSDGDGIREKDGMKLQPRMLGEAESPIMSGMVTTIQQFWREIGVELVPDLLSSAVYEERMSVEHDFDTGVRTCAPIPRYSLDWSFYLRCEPTPGTGNRGGYCNARVDELLTEILSTADRDTQLELLTELQNTVLAELPFAPHAWPVVPAAVNSRVHNVYPNAIDVGFNAETWWVDG